LNTVGIERVDIIKKAMGKSRKSFVLKFQEV